MNPPNSEGNQQSSSTGDGAAKTRRLFRLRRTTWLILSAVVLVAVAAAGYYYRSDHSATSDGPKIQLKSESQALNEEVNQLKSQAPASSASKEKKLKYYDDLFWAQTNAEAYTSAIKTYEARVALSTSGLEYTEYLSAARNYCQVKNKDAAREALASARSALPAHDDPDNGYTRAGVLDTISFISKGCGL